MTDDSYPARVAALLFPDEVADGGDCYAEIGREGEPCRVCAGRNEDWAARIEKVRAALIEALS